MAKRLKSKPVNGFDVIHAWLKIKGHKAFDFQEETWQLYAEGLSGIVNAPTGFGKTFSVFLAVVIDWINRNPDYLTKKNNGLQLLWVTPLRALAKDINRAMEIALEELNIPWRVAVRNGDTPVADRQKQKRSMPEIFIITPESLHLLIANKDHKQLFKTLTCKRGTGVYHIQMNGIVGEEEATKTLVYSTFCKLECEEACSIGHFFTFMQLVLRAGTDTYIAVGTI